MIFNDRGRNEPQNKLKYLKKNTQNKTTTEVNWTHQTLKKI